MATPPEAEKPSAEGTVLEYRSSPAGRPNKPSLADVVFGVVVVLGGVVCALGVVLMLGAVLISRLRGRTEFGLLPASISGVVFGVIAYFMIGLGVGMVRGDPTSRPRGTK